QGERLGLLGRNGSGKSTLFKLILKEVLPDHGELSLPKNYSVGHLAQHLNFTKPTVLEEACLGLPKEEEHDHYKAEKILFGLGFNQEDLSKAPSSFSGGFQIRLNLAKVLVARPNLLLLDEPTNYLDIVSIRWLSRFLKSWQGEMILISHDRAFLDSVSSHTALVYRHQIRRVLGDSAKLYQLVYQEEEIYEKTRLNQEKERKQMEAFIARFKAKASKASAAQSRLKQLEKLPQYQKQSQDPNLDFKFQEESFHAKVMMEVFDLGFSYQKKEPLIKELNFSIEAKDRIAIIGKNGKGKSTLLNLLAGEIKALEGNTRQHPKTEIAYFGQTNIERLNPELSIEEEIALTNPKLEKTRIRSLAGLMMFGGDKVEKRIKVLSGGEKSRVMLAKILAKPANLLLLDEPSNHLDMESIEALSEAIQKFSGAVVLVTHNEEMLKQLVNKLIIFHRGKVEFFNGTYEEFLEKINWEEEELLKSKPKDDLVLNKKELRQKRAEIIGERSKTLGPLKKEVEQLEERICELEAKVAEANQAMLEASEKQQSDQVLTLGYELKEMQTAIEESFELLEEKSRILESQNRKYEDLLKNFS
ncbi:MAG: ABC-F family ATP-binding cassette domain-containing protein, partial [Deltaproteobacteria bacterium]|nr:ABC-F family ATP-binding cassette domain-containing protein [Deltaproteobacteria bacterium]